MSARVQRKLGFPATRSGGGSVLSPTSKKVLDGDNERPSAARRSLFSTTCAPVAAEMEDTAAVRCHRRRDRPTQRAIQGAEECRRVPQQLQLTGEARSPPPSRDNVSGGCYLSGSQCGAAASFTAASAAAADVSTTTPKKRSVNTFFSPMRRRAGDSNAVCDVLAPPGMPSTIASPERREAAITCLTPGKRGNRVADRCDSMPEQCNAEEDEEQCSPSKQQRRQLQKHASRDWCSIGNGSTGAGSRLGGGISGDLLPLSPTKLNVLAGPAAKSASTTSAASTSSPQRCCKENVPARSSQSSAVASRLVAVAVASPLTHRGGDKTAASLVEKVNSTTPRRSLQFDRTVTPELNSDGTSNADLLRRAKRALHTAQPSSVRCREREASEIKAFLSEHVETGKAGSMYISGPPGTGKTALLRQTLDQLELPCHKIFVNCMSVKSWPQLYELVSQGLTPSSGAVPKSCGRKSVGSGAPASAATAKQLQKLLSLAAVPSCGRSGKAAASPAAGDQLVVLVLDEIDQLIGRTQELLYTIFEWPTLESSRLILIGIANALDFTDRLLPRLHARPNCRPKLLHFRPYTIDQIQEIIRSRLAESNASSALDAMAIQFCSRKIAAVSGDIRKALDVCRRSIEIAEVEKPSLTSPMALKSPPLPSKPKGVSLQSMMSLLSDVPCQQSNGSGDDGLPLQQKLAACSLLLLMKHAKLKEVTFGKLHDTYCRICRRRQDVAPTDQSEFLNVCALLEARGVLSLKKAKDDCRMSKVSLKVNETELERVLQDKLLISSVLRDGLL